MFYGGSAGLSSEWIWLFWEWICLSQGMWLFGSGISPPSLAVNSDSGSKPGCPGSGSGLLEVGMLVVGVDSGCLRSGSGF